MDLKQAQACLNSRFFPIPILFGSHALRALAGMSDPDSVDVLVTILDHRRQMLAKQAKKTLRVLRAQSRIDRLWQLWAESRDPRLAEILTECGYETTAGDLLHLCALKSGRVDGMPLSREVAEEVALYLDDPDRELVRAGRRYFDRLRRIEPKTAATVALKQGWLEQLGQSRDDIRMVLDLDVTGELSPYVEAFVRQLPAPQKLFAALCQGRLPGCTDRDPPWELLDFLKDEEESLRQRAEDALNRLRTVAPKAWLALQLKAGRAHELGWQPARVRQILQFCGETQPGVRDAVADYLRQAPDDPAIDEVCYAAWLKTNDEALLQLLEQSGRRPPSLALQALIALLQNRLEEYRALEDDDGDLLRESWLLASSEQRRQLGTVVVHSRDAGLIQAYRQAMRASTDYDLDLHIRALANAGLDEKLFELLPQMSLEHVLMVCRRWRDGSWQPTETADQDLYEQLLAEYERLVAAPDCQPAATPAGTRDLAASWLVDELSLDLIPQFCASPNPLQRARGCAVGNRFRVAGHSPEPHARSPHWIERFCAALSGATPAGLWDDPVFWVRVAAGGLPYFRTLSAHPTPDQYHQTLALEEYLQQLDGWIPTRLAGLLRLMQVLQRRFCTGIEVVAADQSSTAAETEAPLDLFINAEQGTNHACSL